MGAAAHGGDRAAAASSSTRRGRRFQNAHYYAPPYLSPFYSPCLSKSCLHVTLRLRAARHLAADHRDPVAGVPDPVGPGPLPADLLLLPQGLLPLVLAGAAGLRGARRQGGLHRRDALPAHPPELPPLRLVRGGDLHRAADLGRDPRVPVPEPDGGTVRHRRRHARDVVNVILPRRLHVLLPLLPARVRRPRRRVLAGADALPACGASSRGSTSGTRCSPGCRCSAWGSPISTSGWSSMGDHPRPEDHLLMAKPAYETHEHDVIVIGAGGAGLRAAIEAAAQGVSVGLVCKSLLGKAHTVMAEGGIAAAHGQRVAGGQLAGPLPRHHARRQDAQQLAHGPAPRPGGARARARAGALGRPLRPHQGRPHLPARLRRPPLRAPGPRRRPHRPRDDPHAAGPRHPPGHRRLHGVQRRSACSRTATAWPAPSATGARPASSCVFKAKAVVLATGGIGKAWKVTSNSWEYTRRRPLAGPVGRRRPDRHGVRPVPPDRAWCGRPPCAASWSPRACAATAGR